MKNAIYCGGFGNESGRSMGNDEVDRPKVEKTAKSAIEEVNRISKLFEKLQWKRRSNSFSAKVKLQPSNKQRK